MAEILIPWTEHEQTLLAMRACEASLSGCRARCGALEAELSLVRGALGRRTVALQECGVRGKELEARVAGLEAELADALEAYAFWSGSWLWGVAPWRILWAKSKTRLMAWIVGQAVGAAQKKWTLYEFCKWAGIRMLGVDVEQVTGRPAGTI